jgi:competence protein ComEA
VPEGVSRNQLVGWAVAVLVIGVLGARYLARDAPGQPPQGGSAAPAARLEQAPGSGGRIVVHVAGAVRRPGVYRMRSGSRIDDAVRRAGGATHRGDLSAVNLAAKVEDGRQVLVPLRAATAARASRPATERRQAPRSRAASRPPARR